MELDIRPKTGSIGAEVLGIDLANGIDDGELDAILDAFHAHHVLVFPGQSLTPEQQIAFSHRFGELEGHIHREFRGGEFPELHTLSNLDADGRPTGVHPGDGSLQWHTDKSYMPRPSMATMLHALEVPSEGGDTNFANLHAAYDALTGEIKARIDPLHVVHSWEQSRINAGVTLATEEEKADAPPVTHPLARTHPATGRKAIYVGNHASHIEELPLEDGRALIRELMDFATGPDFTASHKWRKGDLVMWDNRCLLHRASLYDVANEVRVLHRTVVRGDVPV